MLWIALADDASHTLPLDDLAVLTYRLHAAANFHVQLPNRWANRAEALQKIPRLAFENTQAGISKQPLGSGQSVVAAGVRVRSTSSPPVARSSGPSPR